MKVVTFIDETDADILRRVLTSDEMDALRAVYGNKRFYIPAVASSSKLATVISAQSVQALIVAFGGGIHVFISKGVNQRKARSRDELRKRLMQMRAKGMSTRAIAFALGYKAFKREWWRILSEYRAVKDEAAK